MLVLNVEVPTGAADLELPSGLTTMLSSIEDEDSLLDARNSTTISLGSSDPSHFFEGGQVTCVDLALVGQSCECGRIFSG